MSLRCILLLLLVLHPMTLGYGRELFQGGDCSSTSPWEGGAKRLAEHGVSIDRTTFRSAPASLKIAGTGQDTWGGPRTTPWMEVQPDAVYIVRFYSKSNLKSGSFSLSMRQIHSPSAESLVFTPLGVVRGVHDWTEHVTRIVSEPKCDRFQIYIHFQAPEGEAWIDDISVTVEFERPPSVLKLFELNPPAKPDPAKADLSYISIEVATPHRAWAKPLHNGPVCALILLLGNHQ